MVKIIKNQNKDNKIKMNNNKKNLIMIIHFGAIFSQKRLIKWNENNILNKPYKYI